MSRRLIDSGQIKKLIDEGLPLAAILERTGTSRTSVHKVRRAMKTQEAETHASKLKRYVDLVVELETELTQAHRGMAELQRMVAALGASNELEAKAEEISERIRQAIAKLAGRGLG